MASKETKQAIISETLKELENNPNVRADLIAQMIQPVFRTMGYSSIGRNLLMFENGWLCLDCLVSWTDGQKRYSCPECGSKELERQDVPEGVLWVYADEILERTIL